MHISTFYLKWIRYRFVWRCFVFKGRYTQFPWNENIFSSKISAVIFQWCFLCSNCKHIDSLYMKQITQRQIFSKFHLNNIILKHRVFVFFFSFFFDKIFFELNKWNVKIAIRQSDCWCGLRVFWEFSAQLLFPLLL